MKQMPQTARDKQATLLRKPRILFISDTPNWAIARNVDVIENRLKYKYDITKSYFLEKEFARDIGDYVHIEDCDVKSYDLIIIRSLLFLHQTHYDRLLNSVDSSRIVGMAGSHHIFDRPEFIKTFNERRDVFDYFFAVSPGVYTRAVKAFPDKIVYNTPQGIAVDKFYSDGSHDVSDTVVIGWAGNADHGSPVDHKRFYKIIVPLVEWVVQNGGTINGRKYRFEFAARKIQNHVKYLLQQTGIVNIREVDYADMRKWYNGIDIYLNASRSEGIASTSIEAVSCGCALITTDVGLARDVVIDDINGRIVLPILEEFKSGIMDFADRDKQILHTASNFISHNVLSWDNRIAYTDVAIQDILLKVRLNHENLYRWH